uniref:WD domain-containing protein, G-beta repeat-containing protein n=1 Tax=Candidatus Kentrum sp. FW TaxID=2126338 RepID=A0A450SHA3_9GAMM|nr:MAG: WD domain-containing protein, G-beta repeat-containing protein [Candidatus Kentron sp. FW]
MGEEEIVYATLKRLAPNYANWRVLQEIQAHSKAICWPDCIEFITDGRGILTGSWDDTLKLWDISTVLNAGMAGGREIRAFRGHPNDVRSIALSPGGRTVLSGSSDKTLKLWDLASRKVIRTFREHSGSVYAVAIAPDGRSALSGSRDNTLKLRGVASGKVIRILEGHSNSVHSIAFSPNGRRAASGDKSGVMILWGEE